jgi:RNA polymerase sigma factor (sigma-70 family)
MKRRLQRSCGMSGVVAERITGAFGRTETTPSEAFEALYRRTFPRVYGYVATLLRDRAAAEEVTAQAFERAYRKRRSFRASRGTEEAWLFGIARNAALDELRRRKRRAVLEVDPEDMRAAGIDEEADGAIRREMVRAALGRLAPRERELVALKFAGGLSNEEIARVLGISASNAGTRLHRTLEKLRRDCDEDA